MSRIDRLVRKLDPHKLTREEHDELARLLGRIESMAVVGAAASGSPTTPTIPQPGGNPKYFRMSGETNNAPMWQNAGMYWYSDNGSTMVAQIDPDASYEFNATIADIDFMVGSNSYSSFLYIDAGLDAFQIGHGFRGGIADFRQLSV
ncbi:MAG: hypothetical protein ACYTBX_19270, partial [Planctomycetota bacterium]